MSELRKFLRYEISGLSLFIYFIIFIFFIAYLGEVASSQKFLLSSLKLLTPIAIIALPIGWFIYQIYDSFQYYLYDPHVSYKIVEDYWENSLRLRKMSKDYYKALVDYILIEDMYKNYGSLADTIRGLWDHYDARSIVGLIIPIISFAIALVYSHIYFNNHNYLLGFEIFVIVIVLNYLFIFRPRAKIYNQVIAQECVLIRSNIQKLRHDNPSKECITWINDLDP